MEEREFVKSLLREWIELPSGDISWCTFDNFYKGHETVNGYRPGFRQNHQSGYFGYQEAFAKLREIKEFWDAYAGNPLDARIDNPNRQLSLCEVDCQVAIARMENRLSV